MYLVKSNNIKTTSINTQFHVPVAYTDYTQGFSISMDVYYDPATWDTTKYNFLCGRGNNTGLHSGIAMPGLTAGTNIYGMWRGGTNSVISISGFTASWYRVVMTVTSTTVVITATNLTTGVTSTGSNGTVGSTTTGDAYGLTFLAYGIEDVTGAYGSVGARIANANIYRGTTCLLNCPLQEGGGTKVYDICNSATYSLSFFTEASGWSQENNFDHHNFLYGYTLLTKSGSLSIRVPNKLDKTEYVVFPPVGYTKIRNVSAGQFWNGAETKVKLEDVATSSAMYLADPDHIFFTDGTGVAKEVDLTNDGFRQGTFDVPKNNGYMFINDVVHTYGMTNFYIFDTQKLNKKHSDVLRKIGMGSVIEYADGAIVYTDGITDLISY